jgi:hypothetical protein
VDEVKNNSPGVAGWRINDVWDDYAVADVLASGAAHIAPFEHIDAAGKVVPAYKEPDVAVITFIDASGLRWRREGNAEQVRVVSRSVAQDATVPWCGTPGSAVRSV